MCWYHADDVIVLCAGYSKAFGNDDVIVLCAGYSKAFWLMTVSSAGMVAQTMSSLPALATMA